ncbi:hypothetical protein [Paenibacillus sp. NAIST15-1]|uniref:hypothetical protein n=1 Tax=Paenibacillus sp. NAIST15-1 TaxID=1605994 RepID=UPI00086DDFA6|nr:hypothetical protein [Paenibacillus sp. NAIST15-1]GAV11424.1 acetoacetyl-CoA synthase [Paenibacillus sp. NAIST15-1]
MGKFNEMLSTIDKEQIESIQNIDYDLWNYSLQQYPQALFDMLCLDSRELDEDERRERIVALDAAYVYLQSTMEEISKELRKKYSTDRLNY